MYFPYIKHSDKQKIIIFSLTKKKNFSNLAYLSILRRFRTFKHEQNIIITEKKTLNYHVVKIKIATNTHPKNATEQYNNSRRADIYQNNCVQKVRVFIFSKNKRCTHLEFTFFMKLKLDKEGANRQDPGTKQINLRNLCRKIELFSVFFKILKKS